MPRKAIDRGRCFLFYPADYLSDPAVRKMSLIARGAYGGALLWNLWLQPEPGVVEDNDRLLASLALATPEEWAQARQEVTAAFDVTTRPGFWIQKRMVAEYAEQCRVIKAKSKAGKASAKARWGNNLGGEQTHNSRVTVGQQSDAGSGSGSGSGESNGDSPPTPRSPSAHGGRSVASAPERQRPNKPRQDREAYWAQREARKSAREARRRAAWRPRSWYGEPRTEPLDPSYIPPGPLSIGTGGRTGVELPGPDRWRPLEPDELSAWRRALSRGADIAAQRKSEVS